MADRVISWYIHKATLANNVAGTNISTEYVLDDDYIPVRCVIRQKEAQAGDANIFDINDDGVSIFPSVKPSINQGVLETIWEAFLDTLTYMKKDSVVTLDADQISGTVPGAYLSVHLEMDKA